jgi:hypothetical protein
MSEIIVIPPALSAADETKLEAGIKASGDVIKTLDTHLSPDQISSIVNVGAARQAEIDDIYTKLLSGHPEYYPADVTPAQHIALKDDIEKTEKNLEAMKSQVAVVELRVKLLKHNDYTINKKSLDKAKGSAKENPTIAGIVKTISEKHHGSFSNANGETVYELPPSASVTVAKVVTGKMIVNLGNTILSVLVVGGSVNQTIKVLPNEGARIPKGWTNIVVTNLSATSDGSFQIHIH